MRLKTVAYRWRFTFIPVIVMAVFGVGSGWVVAADAEGIIGPDVVVFELPNTYYWGASSGMRAYSVGTTSCNPGDEDLEWIWDENRHPVIAQNLYRVTLPDANPPVEHGKIEMLGMSWLKHGFTSLNNFDSECGDGNCTDSVGPFLGVGCTDPYSSHLNGSQSNLGPRSDVNAFTGYFQYPFSGPVGDSTLAGRIQVKESDLVDDSTTYRYFVEGQYVAPDDSAAGNHFNNVSHREADLNGTNLGLVGATEVGRPAIYAWRDIDPTVSIQEVLVPNEGLFVVAYKTGDNGDGTWHYEYAVFNENSHLSGRSFSVPILVDSVITNIGFDDVSYHSGEPYDETNWATNISPSTGWMTWSTDDFAANPNANALRWSTMYNFSFDADSPPVPALAGIGIFRDGGPSSVSVRVEAPAGNAVALFADGFDSGGTGAWSVAIP